jgi:hypothetical protein
LFRDQQARQKRPAGVSFATLVVQSKKLEFYLSDEIFAIHAPILFTMEALRPTILRIGLALHHLTTALTELYVMRLM